MSADLPLNRSGVTGDVSTGGESAGRPSPADATPRPPTPLDAARGSRGEAVAAAGEAGPDVGPGRGESGTDRPGNGEATPGEQPRRRRRRGRRRGRRPSAANTESPAGSAVDGSVSGADDGAVTPARPGEAQASRTKVTPATLASAAAPRPPKPSDLAHATAKRRQRAPDRKPDSGGQQPASRTAAGSRRKRGGRPDALRTAQEVSAGGLVLSSLDKPFEQLSAALIGRLDRRGRMMWSLPKGHIETGETAEQTAMREVAEETGIEGTVVAQLGKIDYWFVSEGRRIHKTVHHYLLRSTGGELSDADYEVSAVAWVPLPDLARRLTYSDERRLARMAEGVIAELTADPDRLARSEARSVRTEPNAYERAAAVRNQRRNQPDPPRGRSRRRRRRPRRGQASGEEG